MRKALNLTLSPEARKMLGEQAAEKGLTLSRYVEMLIRIEDMKTKAQ